MDCFEAEILMLKELEGIASDSEFDRLITHLLSCPDCCRHFRFLKNALTDNRQEEIKKPVDSEILKERENAAVPKDFEVQVMMKIRNINAVTVIKTKVKYR